MAYLRIWRSLFFALFIGTLALGVYIVPSVKIDTDLAGLSPGSEQAEHTKFAIDALRQNIEKRVILLVSGNDEDTVAEVQAQLSSRLSGLNNIKVTPDNDKLATELLSKLSLYRFALLSKEQQQRLSQVSAQTLAEQAHKGLYGLSGQTRLYPFSKDPLGWHSKTLLSLLPTEKESETFSGVVGLSINQGALNMRAQQTLSTALDSIINTLSHDYDVRIDQSGIFFFASDAAQRSKKDIGLISTGSTIGVVLLLLFVFRSARALMLPVASVLLGVSFAFVVSHSLYGQVHVLTIVFGASLIGIVIDYSLHYFYHGAAADNIERRGLTSDASDDEKNALFRALSLSLITSMIGYAALSFSSLQALQKVAVFSCCGLFMAWLSVICLGDFALRQPLRTEQTLLPRIVNGIRRLIALLSRNMLSATIVLTLALGAYSALIAKPFNDSPRVFFKPDTSLLASEQRVAQAASDYEPGRYIVIDARSIEEAYQRHQQLLNIVQQQDGLNTNQFTSLLNWVPSPKQQNLIYQAQTKLYGQDGAATLLYKKLGKPTAASNIQAEYRAAESIRLTPNTAAKMLADGLPPIWFEQGEQVVSFVLIEKGTQADILAPILKEIDGLNYVNTLKSTEAALASQRVSASKLLLLAYFLVAILMVLRNRRISAASITLVPLGASAMLFSFALALGFELNLFHVMALFLVLGFGMDYGIFANEMRSRSATTLQAISLSALTSLLSFGLLALSSIPVVASFGITLLIGNLFNLLGVFIYARLTQPS